MSIKKNIALLMGGRSAEHEVSLSSAQNVVRALDTERFNPLLIFISHQGSWFLIEDIAGFKTAGELPEFVEHSSKTLITLTANGPESRLQSVENDSITQHVDVLYPVLHGPYGEDGSVQGLARLADLPCVGAGILGSSIGMDKDIMKRLLDHRGILNARSQTIRSGKAFCCDDILSDLGLPLYVKPANMGSSVGVSKVTSPEGLQPAIDHAFEFDLKVIIEQEVKGRELEVAVLGNSAAKASDVGEIIPLTDFYSYDSKYVDGDGAKLMVPAELSDDVRLRLQQMALDVFEVMECEGLARIDMFLTQDGVIYVNEINTLPGFTNISMYPKLWEQAGLKQSDLVSQLIDLAVEKAGQLSRLKSVR